MFWNIFWRYCDEGTALPYYLESMFYHIHTGKLRKAHMQTEENWKAHGPSHTVLHVYLTPPEVHNALATLSAWFHAEMFSQCSVGESVFFSSMDKERRSRNSLRMLQRMFALRGLSLMQETCKLHYCIMQRLRPLRLCFELRNGLVTCESNLYPRRTCVLLLDIILLDVAAG